MRLNARRPVSDPVDASKDSNKRTGPEPVGDLVSADVGLKQLNPSHHSVRPRRDSGDPLLNRPELCGHWP
jgi:hypothetical protein